MDYRLFTLNEDIYLHANADTTVVTNLMLRSKKYPIRNMDNEHYGGKEEQFPLKKVYREDNLRVTMLH